MNICLCLQRCLGQCETKRCSTVYVLPEAQLSYGNCSWLREVWGGETDVQYLRIYVRALRQKIEPDPERPEYILTETGVGYRLRGPDS